jgi:uncharacterized membrane-anchored protein
MRERIALIAGLLALAVIDYVIVQRESLVSNGKVVLLELAPVDPRSLMQGDYMALRFRLANDAFGSGRDLKDGRIVVALDERGVGKFKRFEDATPLAPDEVLVRYRVRNGQPKLATNAFFFQEGHAQIYQVARYGEFRASPDGEVILTAMRDANLKVLGPTPQ